MTTTPASTAEFATAAELGIGNSAVPRLPPRGVGRDDQNAAQYASSAASCCDTALIRVSAREPPCSRSSAGAPIMAEPNPPGLRRLSTIATSHPDGRTATASQDFLAFFFPILGKRLFTAALTFFCSAGVPF